MISFSVVTNGPVANAGFILNRFMVNGTNVPKNDAQITTVNNAILTVAANVHDSLISKLYPKIKLEQIKPLINPTPNSFNNFGAILSAINVLLAKPCTIIDDD